MLLSSLSPVILLFFSRLFRLLAPFRLLSPLFALGTGFLFRLWGLLLSLMVFRIETHFQGFFLFGAPLIQVGTSLYPSPGLNLIGCTN